VAATDEILDIDTNDEIALGLRNLAIASRACKNKLILDCAFWYIINVNAAIGSDGQSRARMGIGPRPPQQFRRPQVSELARKIGKSEQYVSQRFCLRELPVLILEKLITRDVTVSQ
jgi:hypothetical protein